MQPSPSTAAAPILVTGAAGFIGSAVVADLLARGHHVIALDHTFSADRLAPHPALEVHQGDVRDAAWVGAHVARASRVLHLAAIAGVHHYLERTQDVLDVNILGTRNVLLAAHEAGLPTLIASTSEAYGKSTATLVEEGDSVLGPTLNARWCYAVSKLAGEHYAWALARRGLPVAAVRYFNVYGPTLDAPGEGRVLSQFLGRLQQGRPLALVDGGEAVRCFCFIDDAVEATVRILLALAPGSPLVGRPWNVGNAEAVSMRTLADTVVALAAHAPGTEVVPGTTFFGSGFEDIPTRIPDTDALAEAVGWRASTPLVDGLRAVLAHHHLLANASARPPEPTIPVIRPIYDADEALIGSFRRALATGRTTNAGPEVTALEAEASRWLGAEGVLAVGSGADGLQVAVQALGVRGRAVLPSFTYVSTLNAVELAGLDPLFCDIDPRTWTLDPHHLAHLLHTHDDIGLVLPVNVFGVPPDLTALADVLRPRGIPMVYDAAHAVGTTVRGLRYEPIPAVTVWSLHATKVLPSTEGGLLASPNPQLRARLAQIRTHGLAPDPLDSIPGFNAKLDELSAATARHGLARLDRTLDRRTSFAARLRSALAEAGWVLQEVPEGVRSNTQNLAARPPGSFASAVAALDAHGVGWRRYFHPPLHQLRRFGGRFSLPVTEQVCASLINLPLHARMDERTLERIEVAVRQASR